MPPVVLAELNWEKFVEANDKCLALFCQVNRWKFYSFFRYIVTKSLKTFVTYFNGKKYHVRNQEIKINLEFISTTMNLPLEGKYWYQVEGMHVLSLKPK